MAAAIDVSTAENFIDKLRGCNSILRKIVSLGSGKPLKKRRLRKQFRKLDGEAFEEALKIEERSKRTICADDLMELGAILCRTTNSPQEAFCKILGLLDIEVKDK